MLVYQQKQDENDYHRLEYFSSIASFVVYTCFSIFSGKKLEDILANERFSIFKKHNAMYLNLTPIQMQPSLTVFDLNAFVNYRVDEINTSMFAPCASEHNRCQIHLYNLNKSIHCVYNNWWPNKWPGWERKFFFQKYSQGKIRIIVLLHHYSQKKRGLLREYFVTKYFNNLTYPFVLMVCLRTCIMLFDHSHVSLEVLPQSINKLLDWKILTYLA